MGFLYRSFLDVLFHERLKPTADIVVLQLLIALPKCKIGDRSGTAGILLLYSTPQVKNQDPIPSLDGKV